MPPEVIHRARHETMDPHTVITMLALYLLSIGGLFLLVDRRVESGWGLGSFAACGVILALACIEWLLGNRAAVELQDLVVDLALAAALLLFIDGLRQVVGRDPAGWRRLLLAWVAFVVARFVVGRAFGANGQEVLLLGVVGVAGLATAMSMLAEARRKHRTMRVPLRVLVVLISASSLMLLVRAVHVLRDGRDALSEHQAPLVYGLLAAGESYLIGAVLLWMLLARMKLQLTELGIRDPLTRLLNREGLDHELRQHFGRRGASPVSMLLIDIDDFQRVVGQHGRGAGEAVLRTVAAMIEARLRVGDFVARLDGDRFLVGCVSAEQSHGVLLAERLRTGMAAMATGLREAGGHLRCTMSIGISRPAGDLEQWAQAWIDAQAALAAARQGGPDRVVCAS